jgi:hypothetical protein
VGGEEMIHKVKLSAGDEISQTSDAKTLMRSLLGCRLQEEHLWENELAALRSWLLKHALFLEPGQAIKCEKNGKSVGIGKTADGKPYIT